MKFSSNRIIALAIISSACLFAVTSCSKSNNNNSGAGFSATVSGSTWASTYPTGGTYTSANGQFAIGGLQVKSGDSTVFALYFFSPIVLNKAISSDTATVDIQYADSKTGNIYDGAIQTGHAIITVTSYDAAGLKVGGTFSGVLYNSVNANDSLTVTNGHFSSAYVSQ
jgi:hypothetical protein